MFSRGTPKCSASLTSLSVGQKVFALLARAALSPVLRRVIPPFLNLTNPRATRPLSRHCSFNSPCAILSVVLHQGSAVNMATDDECLRYAHEYARSPGSAYGPCS